MKIFQGLEKSCAIWKYRKKREPKVAEQIFPSPLHLWGLSQLNWELNTKRHDLQPHVQHQYEGIALVRILSKVMNSHSRTPALGTPCCIFMEQVKSQGCKSSVNTENYIPLEEAGKQIVSSWGSQSSCLLEKWMFPAHLELFVPRWCKASEGQGHSHHRLLRSH